VRLDSVRRYSLLALVFALAYVCSAQSGPSASSNASAASNAEVGMPVLENFGVKEVGLTPETWTIMQDRRGVMYFGISGGQILEYDGVTWRKIFTPSSVVRSIAMDDSGKIWVGAAGDFGYLEPDPAGTLHFVSLLAKVPAQYRGFTDAWEILITPQGVFFRSYELLFRWDGNRIQVWSPWQPNARFQALSAVRGHIYTAQDGIGLQEIVGDELRAIPGGDAYKGAGKLFLNAYDDGRILVSARNQLLTLYDGQKVTTFPTQADEYLTTHKTYKSTIFADGRLCITTLSGGAVILSHDGRLLQIVNHEAGVVSSPAFSSFLDRDGALWLGTDIGISRVEINSPVSIFVREGAWDVTRFQGSIFASAIGSASVARLESDRHTGRPNFIPLPGPNQGWTMLVFKDPEGKAPDQLLTTTNEGVMRVLGDKLVPAMAEVHGYPEQAYDILHSRETSARIFIGHANGISSMRWNGSTWIDEGRLPNTVYQARTLVEDAQGALWVGGGTGSVLRIEVAPTGMRDSKAQVI